MLVYIVSSVSDVREIFVIHVEAMATSAKKGGGAGTKQLRLLALAYHVPIYKLPALRC